MFINILKDVSDTTPIDPYKKTNTTCDVEGKCICWIPDTVDDRSCKETKCIAEEKDGLCVGK